MARKQSEWLSDFLSDDDEVAASPAPTRTERARGTTLLGRSNAIARAASREVTQVTELLLDPDRVRVWPGNARNYANLSETNCRELLDSLIAEGGQKFPALVRKIEGDPDHDYEVVAGTRRHWSISWLRRHSYPDMRFLAQVAKLDDETAFRLADIENRARADISDFERASNYAAALKTYYNNHLSRMAERLKLSKGWLSKMIRVAELPQDVIAAFGAPSDLQLKPAYALAQMIGQKDLAPAILAEAKNLAVIQQERRNTESPPLPANQVMKRLLSAQTVTTPVPASEYRDENGTLILSVTQSPRGALTIKIQPKTGMSRRKILDFVNQALKKSL